MTASILVYSIFTGVCYFAQAAWQLGAFRFLAALGMGGEWALGVALVVESWPDNKRPLMAGVIGAAANVGNALIGVVAWLFPVSVYSWRWVMLGGLTPAFLALFIIMLVPESHRWQESIKQGKAHPLREIFGPKLWKTTLLAIAFSSVALIGTWGSVQWLPLWAAQMADETMPQVKGITMLIMSIGAIVGCFLGSWIGARLGRRPAFFILCAISMISCAILFRTVSVFGLKFMVGTFIVGMVTATFYGWLPLYLPELFPTRARATGQGVSYNAGRIFAAVGAITQGQLVNHFGGSYAQAGAVVTLVYLVGMVLIWFGKETKGQQLPE